MSGCISTAFAQLRDDTAGWDLEGQAEAGLGVQINVPSWQAMAAAGRGSLRLTEVVA